MLPDKRKQANKALPKQEHKVPQRQVRREQRTELSPPIFRSPALDTAKRHAAQQRDVQRRAQPATGRGRLQKMRYAVEDALPVPVLPRKSLPPLRSKRIKLAQAAAPASGGLRMGWLSGRRKAATGPLMAAAPVQVMSAEEETKIAALEMRLPRLAGKMDATLLIVVLALLCSGLVMVYSASAFVAARCCSDASYFFQKQLLGAILGVAVMLVTMRIDYRQWRRFTLVGMAISVPLLVVVLKFGTSAYGASRWLSFGSFISFQPSELIKLVLALYIADWLARKGQQVGTFLYGLAPFVILVGVILGLVLLENDMGTALVIAGLATAMFFTAGANILQFALAMGCGILIFMTQAFRGYRLLRLIGFMNPFNPEYITNLNLQLYQSLLALGSGNWFGLGLGESRQKTGYLPLPHIDSIFAIIGEELGFMGGAIIIMLFLFLAFRGFRLARRTPDIYGALLATGITTWLVIQAMINIGATTASIPYTGVPLPFISYGGSSLVVSLAAVGVLLNISRYIQEPESPALSRSVTITLRDHRKRG